ncbi:MAG: diadenylate cyclase CdaA [Nitrospirota bacterium]|nr:diadenylate cyclase CdaA [Nitrospirota bacterium]
MLELLYDFRFPQDLLDILLVSFICYRLLLIIKGTRALRMMVGIGVLLGVLLAANQFGLHTLDWLVTSFWSQIVLALIILFAPEIRRGLAQFGRIPFAHLLSPGENAHTVDEVVRAAVAMASNKIGGILVIERETRLLDIVEVGTRMDALVSKDVLLAIFNPASPIHDGAAILHGGRVVAAGCFLPIALRVKDPSLGTRHRAAIGLTEETDALALVISEETGNITLASGGTLIRSLDGPSLRNELNRLLGEGPVPGLWVPRLRGWYPERDQP